MTRGGPCLTCGHPDREAIERAALRPGTSIRRLAHAHGLDPNTVHRHMKNHVPAAMADHVPAGMATRAEATRAQASWGGRLAAYCESSLAELDGVVERAKRKGDDRCVVMAVKGRSTVLETWLKAAELQMKERCMTSPEATPEKVNRVAEVAALFDRKVKGEVAKALAAEGIGVVVDHLPHGSSGVRPPGHLDAFPDSAEAV